MAETKQLEKKQKFVQLCDREEDVLGDRFPDNSNLILIQAPTMEGKQKTYFCHTADELKNILTYSEDYSVETNPGQDNLPAVAQEGQSYSKAREKQKDKKNWYYKLPYAGVWVDHTLADLFSQNVNTMLLHKKGKIIIFRSTGVSAVHDQEVEAYFVTALKRCDLFDDYPDCDEFDHFGEETNVEQEEEEENEEEMKKLMEASKRRMEEMKKKREEQNNSIPTMDIHDPYITLLPELPAGLTMLNCTGCTSLTNLPELPAGLTMLNCTGCTSLTSPPELPAGLTELYCSGCTSLLNIPELPAGLTRLDCTGCRSLTNLPELPAGLPELYCEGCTSLTSLPELPAGLIVLDCSGCTSLTNLPELPESLARLYCQNCTSLTSLPELPAGLIALYCTGCTSLTSLPELPAGLIRLDCTGCTSLNSLPVIPDEC